MRRSLVSIYSSFPTPAAVLWDQMKTSSAFLSTGLPRYLNIRFYLWHHFNFSIDSLLGGGVFTGELIEVSGQPSIGKTQVINNNNYYFFFLFFFLQVVLQRFSPDYCSYKIHCSLY